MRNILLSAILLFLLGCDSSSKDNDSIIDNSRTAVIELNQKYNQLYNIVMKEYIKGNSEYEAAGICLQSLTKELMAVNKALLIDCKKYDEKGKPQMIEDQSGNLSPVEIIPNELKIEK